MNKNDCFVTISRCLHWWKQVEKQIQIQRHNKNIWYKIQIPRNHMKNLRSCCISTKTCSVLYYKNQVYCIFTILRYTLKLFSLIFIMNKIKLHTNIYVASTNTQFLHRIKASNNKIRMIVLLLCHMIPLCTACVI